MKFCVAVFEPLTRGDGNLFPPSLEKIVGGVYDTVMRRIPLILFSLLLSLDFTHASPGGDRKTGPSVNDVDPFVTARLGSPGFRHGDEVTAISFSADGKRVISGGKDCSIIVWEYSSGSKLVEIQTPTPVVHIACSRDGSTIVGCGNAPSGGWIKGWKGSSGEEQLNIPVSKIAVLTFSPAGDVFAAGGEDGSVTLWKTASGERIAGLAGHRRPIGHLVFSHDGTFLASADESAIRLWDIPRGTEAAVLTEEGKWIGAVAFAGKGQPLLAYETHRFADVHKRLTSDEYEICLWDVKQRAKIRGFPSQRREVNRLQFSSDNRSLVSVSRNGREAVIWNVENGEQRSQTVTDVEEVRAVALSPDAGVAAIGGAARTIRFWSMSTGKEIPRHVGHHDPPTHIAFSPDAKTVSSAGRKGGGESLIVQWDVASGKILRTLPVTGGEITALRYSPDGAMLACATTQGRIRFWKADSEEITFAILHDGQPKIVDLCFTPDSRSVIFGVGHYSGNSIQRWDLTTKKEVWNLPCRSTVRALSTDGRSIALLESDNRLRLLGIDGKSEQAYPELRIDAGTGIALSPDGGSAIILSEKIGHSTGAVTLFDLRKKCVEWTTALESDGRGPAIFHPDGALVMIGSGKSLLFKRVADYSNFALIPGLSFSVSRDGALLAFVMPDGRVNVADMDAFLMRRLWSHLLERTDASDMRLLNALSGLRGKAPSFLSSLAADRPELEKEWGRLIEEMDDDRVEIRDRATDEFRRFGFAAEHFLRRTLATGASPEASARIRGLISELERDPPTLPAAKEQLRALQVLAEMKTEEATRMLQKIAQTSSSQRIRQAASAAKSVPPKKGNE